jgi:hypothetical protein
MKKNIIIILSKINKILDKNPDKKEKILKNIITKLDNNKTNINNNYIYIKLKQELIKKLQVVKEEEQKQLESADKIKMYYVEKN